MRFASSLLAALTATLLLALPASAQFFGGIDMSAKPGGCDRLTIQVEQNKEIEQPSELIADCRFDPALRPIQEHAWGSQLASMNIKSFYRVSNTLHLLISTNYVWDRDSPRITELLNTTKKGQHGYTHLVILGGEGTGEIVDLRGKPSK